MKNNELRSLLALCMLATAKASAAVLYVDANSASNLVGQAGTMSYTDTDATGPGPFFYRVGVQR